MAKVYGVGSQLSGKVGQITYRQTKYGTVAYENPVKAKIPRRSEKQMYVRTQWANLAAVYRQFNMTLKKAFEDIGSTMSVYNAFVQANTNVVRVYITKKIRLNGGSVLAPYQITRGSLPSIAAAKNTQDVLVTDLSLGSLTLSATTTVAEFSAAVIAYNDQYEEGDQITFFYGVQTVDQVTGVPRAKITGYKVVLDSTDTMPLWDLVTALGFSTVGGKLGMSQAITDGAAAWIHSRENGSGLKVSTQFLYVDSSVLATYQSESAFGNSADSYGGINTAAVYLKPTTNGTTIFTNDTNGTDGTEQGGQTGGGDNIGGGGSSGGQTGGGDTGGSGGGDDDENT